MIEKKVNKFLDWLRESKDSDERELRQVTFKNWYDSLTENQQEQAQTALKKDRDQIRRELRSIREEVELLKKGVYKEAS